MVPSTATASCNKTSEIRVMWQVCGAVSRMLQETETEICTDGHDST
jgi:hypothetical protein